VRVKIIADLGTGVFEKVTASTVILAFQKGKPDSKHELRVARGLDATRSEKTERILQESFRGNTSFAFNLYADASSGIIIKKLISASLGLGEVCLIRCGIATGPDKSKYISDRKLSSVYKPLIEGKDIKRYLIGFCNRFILYDRKKLHRPREESIFLAIEKLVTQRIAGGDHALVVAYDDQQFYTFNSTNAILLRPGNRYSLKYILGLLNSLLLNWYYIVSYTNRSQLTVNISQTYLERLPIHRIDFSVPAEKDQHDRMVTLVDSMLRLQTQLAAAKSEAQNVILQRQIAAKDAEIDRLVYELYGLTAEEIAVVEGASAQQA
jgi:hypothetical protein